ncbi:hypothetical protein AB0M95_09785 [Sphaerisporangium sp. NPDC051017]|uniref:hypothetical protein n=1 Tax=Sphaerisporangium sp. NPDC051017 TaxID=3154636 RepID=UPI00341691CB
MVVNRRAVIAAALGHRFPGADVVVNRVLVYGSLTVLTGGIHFGLTWLFGAWFGGRDGEDPSAGPAAALATGALFNAMRLRLQRGVDRLLKVEGDPYRLADRLSRTRVDQGVRPVRLRQWRLGKH